MHLAGQKPSKREGGALHQLLLPSTDEGLVASTGQAGRMETPSLHPSLTSTARNTQRLEPFLPEYCSRQ